MRSLLPPALAMLICTGVLAGCTSGGAASPGGTGSTPAGTSKATATSGTAVNTPAARGTAARAKLASSQRGAVRSVTIKSSTGYVARPALVYLPTAALRSGARGLPVLELFHGTSGGPGNWFDKGHLQATADAFAAAHAGRAPVIVVPDINGSVTVDTECVHTKSGDVEKYLAVDVPHYVMAHFPVSSDWHKWAVGGLSEGGMCALMIGLRHYASFRAIGDLSGIPRPTVGESDNEPSTVRELFGGSQTAYDQHDPTWLLRRHRYPHLAAWFVVGSSDSTGMKDQRRVSDEARAAGMTVHAETAPGGHHWGLWTSAMGRFLPWLWKLIGP